MPPPDVAPFRDFLRQVGERLRAQWISKALGLTVGMSAFFTAYFFLLRHPAYPVAVMPRVAVDRWIGFHPGALPLYVSLWVYVPLAFVLQKDRLGLRSSGLGAILLSLTGLGIFFRWPTAVPELGSDWASHPSFAFLKHVDASGNACPSLHVAFAVWTALLLGPLLREMRAAAIIHVGNWLWCVAIIYSTLAIGQHVALDAAAGMVLGALGAVPALVRRC
jgi:membrane-associated phospholipid phosphatase